MHHETLDIENRFNGENCALRHFRLGLAQLGDPKGEEHRSKGLLLKFGKIGGHDRVGKHKEYVRDRACLWVLTISPVAVIAMALNLSPCRLREYSDGSLGYG